MKSNTQFLGSLSLRSLFLLRLAVDDVRDNTNIEQDILDLYLFPDRLTDSYPDEWRAYIKRRLVQLNINIQEVENMMLREPLNVSANDVLHRRIISVKPRFERLIKELEQSQMASKTNNVSALKTPLHKWLAWAVS